jgi:hypothetical protein
MTSKYSSTSVETTLQNAITSSGATSMVVSSGTGSALMGGVTLGASNVDVFSVAIDVDTINEEIVFITNQSSDTMTIVRGQAGTSPVTHSAGATVKHVLSSYDLTNFQGAVTPIVSLGFGGSTSGTTTVQATAVAGTNTLTLPATTSDTLVGKATTDTLTNKTLTTPTINSAKINLAFNAQTGTTYTLVASDSSKLVTASNAAAIVVTIPPSIFTAGEQINVQQIGAGQVTFAAGVGVTITSTGATSAAPKLTAQYSACTVICTASNTFTVIGDLS